MPSYIYFDECRWEEEVLSIRDGEYILMDFGHDYVEGSRFVVYKDITSDSGKSRGIISYSKIEADRKNMAENRPKGHTVFYDDIILLLREFIVTAIISESLEDEDLRKDIIKCLTADIERLVFYESRSISSINYISDIMDL